MQISRDNILIGFNRLRNYYNAKFDIPLALFLTLVLNYRFSFKLVALVGIYYYRPNLKIEKDSIIYFYLLMPLLGLVNFLFIKADYTLDHFIVVFAGCLIWLSCLLAYHQIKLSVRNSSTEQILNTLKLITVFNLLVSFYDFFMIVITTHTINPYTQISPPPFGISSGDLIGGVFGGMHLVNTVICCFLTIFFIYQSSFLFALFALIPFLLTGSNLGSIILTFLLLYILFGERELIKKYFAASSIAIICIFYIKVTPENQKYMVKVAQKIQNQFAEKKNLADTAIVIGKANERVLTKEELINLYVQHKKKLNRKNFAIKSNREETVLNVYYSFEKMQKVRANEETNFVFFRKDSLRRIKLKSDFFEYGNLKKFDLDKETGKFTSFCQTKDYLSTSPIIALFGAGIGSFSSRLAFITSQIVEDSRVLMMLPYYETSEFKENHKAIFKYLMFLDDETHSITNLPFCWYNQLFGEYGILGFAVFCIFYIGFFVKRYSIFTYGKALLISMLAFFLFDYWYERISVMIVFELIMLVDLKMKQLQNSKD